MQRSISQNRSNKSGQQKFSFTPMNYAATKLAQISTLRFQPQTPTEILMRRLIAIFIFSAIYSTSASYAQDIDISPKVSNNKIVTGGLIDATSTFIGPSLRVFGFSFQEDPSDPYFAGDPGFNAPANSGLPASTQLKFTVESGASFGLPANLTYWNGTGAIEFGHVPSGESLRFTRGALGLTVGDTLGDQPGFSVGTVQANQSLHQHIFSFLLGSDGNSIPAGPGDWGGGDGAQAADGIYLSAWQFSSSDSTIGDSLPIFILFNNGLSDATETAAIAWVEDNLLIALPEPSSCVLLLVGGLGVLACRLATLKKRPK